MTVPTSRINRVNHQTFTISVPAMLFDRLVEYASSEGITRNKAINLAIEAIVSAPKTEKPPIAG